MESSQMVSWQFENFSTAELSPPTSPVSPSSPLFYNDGSKSPSSPSGTFKGLNSGATMLSTQSQKPALSSALSSRAQTACNILNELEQMHSFEHQNGRSNSQRQLINVIIHFPRFPVFWEIK